MLSVLNSQSHEQHMGTFLKLYLIRRNSTVDDTSLRENNQTR